MSVFVDTSAFIALLADEDLNHASSRTTWDSLLGTDEGLWTSNYVVSETVALLQRRVGMGAVRELVVVALPALQIEWVTPETHDPAVASLLVAGRRDLSLVDCVSFELMRQRGIARAFTFDVHFAEQGFECLPGSVAQSAADPQGDR
jgi:predicted nucleic acid-binding protein